MTGRRLAYLQIVACTLTWGSIGVVRKQVDLDSTVVVFFRLLIGMVVVGAWMTARGRLAELRPRARPVLLVSSGVVLGVHWVLEFEAFRRLDIAPAVLIVFLGPVLMAAAAPFVLRERLHLVPVVALAVAFTGIGLIAVPGIDRFDGVGLASAAGSAVLFATLLLQGKLLTEHYTSAALVVWQLGVASVFVAPALAGASGAAILAELPTLVVLGAVYTGLLGIIFFHAVRALPAQRLGVLFYLEPASAVPYAWLFLSERPTVTTLVGGALILLAGLGIILSDRTATMAPADMPEPPPSAALEEAY